jgi:hypothetical protein
MTDPSELRAFLSAMQDDQKTLRHTIVRIMWHMRGSLSREEAWTLSASEREEIVTLVDEHRDLVEKTGLALM